MHSLFGRVPVSILVVLCLTLGLALFVPESHVWEKLKMLATGVLTELVDSSIFCCMEHPGYF